MHVSCNLLSLMLSSALFGPGSAGGSDQPAEKSKPDAAIKREELRYDGKSFEEWRRNLLTDLKLERRVEALTAIRAFAAKGYAAEAAAAAIEVMEDYAASEIDRNNERTNVDHAAELVIEKAGAAAQPVLLRALKRSNKNQRLFALSQLWKDVPITFALPIVTELALDKDTDVRKSAICVLMCHYTGKGILKSLSRALKDKDTEVRCDALSEITAEGHYHWDDTLLKLLLPALRDKEEAVRLAAVDGLARVAGHWFPSLYRVGEDWDQERKLLDLSLYGSTAVPGLIAAFKDPSPKVRCHIVEALVPVVSHSTQVAQAMNNACKDPDPDVRKAATKALSEGER